jgi:hypothetical protein
MNNLQTSSFGSYEAIRILVPGFYFVSLSSMFYITFINRYISLPLENGYAALLFVFFVIVSGLTMYAKETTKRRRAFVENQPSTFLQEIARRSSTTSPLHESEARQLYFFILNNHIPQTFHEKVFFFGTIYHVMIHIRRSSLWFAILSILCLSVEIILGSGIANLQGLISFCILVCMIYVLNVTYNKADRKMQENYQDQIFWLQMNEELIKNLLQHRETSIKGLSL